MINETKYNEVYERTKDFGRTQFIKEIMSLEEQKQEIIKYLEEQEQVYKKVVQTYEDLLRKTNKDDFYYSSHLKTIHKSNAKREMIKDILDKITGDN